MTPQEFAKEFYILKQERLADAFNGEGKTEVSLKIAELNLDIETKKKLKYIISTLLTDVLYTVLLGIDGAAQIGESQESYKLFDEDDNELTGGEIEGFAYEYFHENQD